MFCRNCGSELEEDAIFCTKCGKKIKPEELTIIDKQPIYSIDNAKEKEESPVNNQVDSEKNNELPIEQQIAEEPPIEDVRSKIENQKIQTKEGLKQNQKKLKNIRSKISIILCSLILLMFCLVILIPFLLSIAAGQTPLIFAAKNGNSVLTIFLITFGANVNKGTEYSTPLMEAAEYGHCYIAELLIKNGADVNFINAFGFSPLSCAVEGSGRRNRWGGEKKDRGGDDYIVELLIKAGADVNLKNGNTCTPLMEAAYSGLYSVAKLLITNGADVNARTYSDGKTSLIKASKYGYCDIAELLIENGADLNVMDDEGKTALDYSSTEEMTTLLKKHGAKY